jgi:hypothetical protein
MRGLLHRALLVFLALALTLPLAGIARSVEARTPTPLGLCTTDDAEMRLVSNIGWWGELSSPQLLGGEECRRYRFMQEPGTQAQFFIQILPPPPGSPVGPREALLDLFVRTSYGQSLRLRESDGAGPHPIGSVLTHPNHGRTVPHDIEVRAFGAGRYKLLVLYGAIPSPYQTEASANRPTVERSEPSKVEVTGDFDHRPYRDPSFRGEVDAERAGGNDANTGGDAGGATAPAVVPLGDSGIRLGQRRLFINNRVGAVGDAEDWYELRAQVGTQVIVNAWATRYDVYGGDLTFEMYRVDPITGERQLLCSMTSQAPEEPVFNSALGSGCTTANGYVSPNPDAPEWWPTRSPAETRFLLRVRASSAVRYSFTVDYVGDPIPPGFGQGAATPSPQMLR